MLAGDWMMGVVQQRVATQATAVQSPSADNKTNSPLTHTPSAHALATRKTNTRPYTFKTRQPAAESVPRPTKSPLLEDPAYAVSTLSMECCAKHCLRRFSVQEVLDFRKRFVGKNEADIRQLITSDIICFMDCEQVVHYAVMGLAVCYRAYKYLCSVSRTKLDTCVHAARERLPVVATSSSSTLSSSAVQSESAHAWLKQYFDLMCDQVSEKMWVLPAFLRWCDLYVQYKSEEKERAASQTTFASVRKRV